MYVALHTRAFAALELKHFGSPRSRRTHDIHRLDLLEQTNSIMFNVQREPPREEPPPLTLSESDSTKHHGDGHILTKKVYANKKNERQCALRSRERSGADFPPSSPNIINRY